MTRTVLRTLLGLALLLPFAPALPEASADGWEDARKEFRTALREEDWKLRRDAYLVLLDYDGAEAVDEALKALRKEDNAAVVTGAIETLGLFQSPEAREVLEREVRRGKGDSQRIAFLALADAAANPATALMLELLDGKDEMLAAQAALALGRAQAMEAAPRILPLLERDAWQLRAAGARALRLLAGPVPEEEPGKPPPPWLPPGYPKDEVLAPLVDLLDRATGVDRRDAIEALERITKQDFGWDPRAWRLLLEGKDPAQIPRLEKHPPYVFGIPIFGQRVVVVYDHSLCTDDPHPFTDRARLQALCEVPGGRPVPWYELRTTKQFTTAWVTRLVNDLPDGARFDLVTLGGKVSSVLGRLQPVNPGTRQKVIAELEELDPTNVVDTLTALDLALDEGGRKDTQAWAQGPDEVVFTSCSVPWLAEVTDQEVIGAQVGRKARMRMVSMHSAGVGPHPFVLMRRMAEDTGGTYLDLSK